MRSPRLDRNASVFPSGDHRGEVSDFGENVNWRNSPEATFNIQIWDSGAGPFGNSETTQARRDPSGEKVRSVMRRVFSASSGVNWAIDGNASTIKIVTIRIGSQGN